jgi:hydroxymethylglutaryl-CoA reductase
LPVFVRYLYTLSFERELRMTPHLSSRISGFYKLSLEERKRVLSEAGSLPSGTWEAYTTHGGLSLDQAEHMIENVIGLYSLPLGVALNFLINGREFLVPMAIEEPSVVAGASFMAKLAREGGGFQAQATRSEMIGQIQVLRVPDPPEAQRKIFQAKEELLRQANLVDPILVRLGGGAKDVDVRILEETPVGTMLVVHLIIDARDAMGANAVNTAAEQISPLIEELTGGEVRLRILSNLADRRLATARCRIPQKALQFSNFSGEEVRDRIIEAWAFAAADPYRAATHNKGIMNGVDAVLIATGNDWRAVEAGAHAYASREGRYTSLSKWWASEDGGLAGELKMPLAVGTVGGATRVHPAAKASLELLRVEGASELAEVIVSVGLAQNLAALRALATEGIQRGHMSLHARQIAIQAGAEGEAIAYVAERLVSDGIIRLDRAQMIFSQWKEDHN